MALINYTGKNIFGTILRSNEIIRLLPGINEIEDDKLAEMKTHPLFKVWISKGKVVILQDNVGKDGKRSIEEMLEYIPKIIDTKLLKKIIQSDGRDSVISAAKNQLDNIKNPSIAKDKAEIEHFS